MQRAVVVSIHDVAPLTRAAVAQMLTELSALGIARCSLLVVPNYHHLGSSLGDPSFVEWLRALERLGHEIVIHGFNHQRPRREGESAHRKFITRIYTADEGEFYDLEYETALWLMQEAKEDFAAHGFRPGGFIAPAWLLGAEAERAAIDAGFRYTTTLRGVRDFASGREFLSQSLVYSTRSGWRRALSLRWNRILFRRLRNDRLLRIGLHPPDLRCEAVWRQITSLVVKALGNRQPVTYENWLAQYAAVRDSHSALV